MNQPLKAALEKPAALTAVMGRATPSFKEQESLKTYSGVRTIPVDNTAQNAHPTLVPTLKKMIRLFYFFCKLLFCLHVVLLMSV